MSDMRIRGAMARTTSSGRTLPVLLLLSTMLAGGGLAGARAGQATPAEEPQSPDPAVVSVDVHRYGDTDATCREWSNGCQICLRQDDGAIACSTPGIACLPKRAVCAARK